VSEYELGSSGLPRVMFHHNNRGKIDLKSSKIMKPRPRT
jgi:hypothetical protein